MSDLDEIKNHLRRIGKRALERDTTNHRPLICYALHPDVMSEEEYNIIRQNDFGKIYAPNPADGDQNYAAGLIVFLIRVFFEESNGGTFWAIWGICNNDNNSKNKIFLFVSSTPWGNDPYLPDPEKNTIPEKSTNKEDKWYNWLCFQCWMLKCEENKGKGANRLAVNRRIFKSMKEQDVCSWETILNTDASEYTIKELEEGYIQQLLESYKKEYLLSLCVVSPDEEEFPDELETAEWSWLRALWGIAPSKDILSTKWQLTEIRNRYYLNLANTSDAFVKQNGEVIDKDYANPCIESCILDRETKEECIIRPIIINDTACFKYISNGGGKRGYQEIKHESAYPNEILVIHKIDNPPRIIVENSSEAPSRVCERIGESVNVYSGGQHTYDCSRYVLPRWDSEEKLPASFTLKIGEARRIQLKRNIKVEICDVEDEESGTMNHCVIEGASLSINGDKKNRCVLVAPAGEEETRVMLRIMGGIQVPRKTTSNEGVSLCEKNGNLMVSIHRSAYEKTIRIDLFSKIDKCAKFVNLYVLPEDWRSRFAHAENWYEEIEERQREVWVMSHKELHYPLSQTYWWWELKDKTRCTSPLNVRDYDAFAKLRLYTKEECSLELFLNNKPLRTLDQSLLDYGGAHKLMGVIDQIMDDSEVYSGFIELRIKNQYTEEIVMKGAYVPMYRMMEHAGKIISRSWMDLKSLVITHENHFFSEGDEYRKVISPESLTKNIRGAELIPSVYFDGWPEDGCIIVSLKFKDSYKKPRIACWNHCKADGMVNRHKRSDINERRVREILNTDGHPLEKEIRRCMEIPLEERDFWDSLISEPEKLESILSAVEDNAALPENDQQKKRIILMEKGAFRHFECKCEFYKSIVGIFQCSKVLYHKDKEIREEKCIEVNLSEIKRNKLTIVDTLQEWCQGLCNPDGGDESNKNILKILQELGGKLLKDSSLGRFEKVVKALEQAKKYQVINILSAAMLIMVWRYLPDYTIPQSTMRDVWESLPAHKKSDALGHMCRFLAYLKFTSNN